MPNKTPAICASVAQDELTGVGRINRTVGTKTGGRVPLVEQVMLRLGADVHVRDADVAREFGLSRQRIQQIRQEAGIKPRPQRAAEDATRPFSIPSTTAAYRRRHNLCINGHLKAGENATTVMLPSGKTTIRCRSCYEASVARYWAKRKSLVSDLVAQEFREGQEMF